MSNIQELKDRESFEGVEGLRPAARHYEKHDTYCHHTPGTKKWKKFWKEERRRCLEGHEANGMRITGFHYFYLNYFPIDRSVEEVQNGKKYKKREYAFPDFYDGDYDFFWLVEIARKGITKENYDKLNLGVKIHPDELTGEKQMTVLKARRKGYSYKAASMLCRNYYHIKRSKNFVFAFDKKYLEGDGIYQKALDGMAFVDTNTPFAQPRLIDRESKMIVKSGYKINENGKDIPSGFQSLVQGISLKDNPDGARGRAGELILFEEMGKFPGLKKAWDITHHTVKEGKDALGIMIAFGTGGTEGADFAGAEELFYEPEANDCLRINNQWDDGADGSYCGHFVPIYQNLRGFIDENGNSNIRKAREYEKRQRKLKKEKSKTGDTYSQYVAETPFKPREAILTTDINLLPTQQLAEQKNEVQAQNKYELGTTGKFVRREDGSVKFRFNADAEPVYKYPHNKKEDATGCPVIYEAPQKIGNDVPNGMYVVVHDPFAQDTTAEHSEFSLGSAYVIKRTNKFSQTYNECIVASYVGRPHSQDEYNRQLFMLAEYYNAKIGFENDRGDIIGFARRHKKLHMLEEEFKFMDKKELQGNTRRSFGMNMTTARKEQGEIYLRDWLLTPVKTYEDGSQKLVLHTIVDPALLEELIKYNKKGNFDRVMSLIVGMYHLKEKFNQEVEAVKEQKHEEFFDRLY